MTGISNIAQGYQSLKASLGNYNIGIGSLAGCLITTGVNNTVIGSLPAAAGCVCTLLLGAGTCERIRVDNGGLYVNNVASSQITSLGVGTAASGTTGEIRATNNITAYYSDDRLKTRLGVIENALDKVAKLDTFYYEANDLAQSFGYKVVREVGLSAQQVQAIMPEVVAPAPIDDRYLTVRYERLIALAFAAIKELKQEVETLKTRV